VSSGRRRKPLRSSFRENILFGMRVSGAGSLPLKASRAAPIAGSRSKVAPRIIVKP